MESIDESDFKVLLEVYQLLRQWRDELAVRHLAEEGALVQ